MTVEPVQVGFVVQPKGTETGPNGRPQFMIALQIMTPASMSHFYICDVTDNYQDIAKQLHDRLCEAGVNGRRAQSGIVVAKGGINGSGPHAPQQGRQQRRQGGAG